MTKPLNMKKSMLAAGALALGLVAFQPAPASADVNFQFGFNAPGFSGGWHGGGRQGGGYHDRRAYRMSCREVRRILRNHYGFRRIRAQECNGGRYTFRARRDGDVWRIKVNSYTGEIVRMRRI